MSLPRTYASIQCTHKRGRSRPRPDDSWDHVDNVWSFRRDCGRQARPCQVICLPGSSVFKAHPAEARAAFDPTIRCQSRCRDAASKRMKIWLAGDRSMHPLSPHFQSSSSLGETIRCQFIIMTIRCQFIIIASLASSRDNSVGVSSSLLLPLHQVGKLDSWEDFQDRQAMTLFTTRSTAGTTEPMSSAPPLNEGDPPC